jgi:hypothetical protein
MSTDIISCNGVWNSTDPLVSSYKILYLILTIISCLVFLYTLYDFAKILNNINKNKIELMKKSSVPDSLEDDLIFTKE